MRMFMYTVYDSCAKMYDRPQVAHADGEMMRVFGDICLDADHPFGKHPEHYSLFRIGEFDNCTSEITPEDRVCLMTGLEAVANARQVNGDQLRLLDENISPGGTD